ncbi:MAG: hypothetical protein LBC71_03130 [Oscillospiraceae bacterium]|jgi:hypothetical protein|nr:hypothetical protein [Oscillospiraceae bacterium]
MLEYEISDLDEIWREGDVEMPDRLKRIVKAAEDEMLLRSLMLTTDTENTIRYNADKNNQSVSEYVTSLVTASLQPV